MFVVMASEISIKYTHTCVDRSDTIESLVPRVCIDQTLGHTCSHGTLYSIVVPLVIAQTKSVTSLVDEGTA